MHQIVLQHSDVRHDDNKKKQAGYLHLAWENALIDTGQTFDCRILDGRREHKASLANMAPRAVESCDQHMYQCQVTMTVQQPHLR